MQESIEEIEENSEYSLEFDDEGWRDNDSITATPQQQAQQQQQQQQSSQAVKSGGGAEKIHGHQQGDDLSGVSGPPDSQRLLIG